MGDGLIYGIVGLAPRRTVSPRKLLPSCPLSARSALMGVARAPGRSNIGIRAWSQIQEDRAGRAYHSAHSVVPSSSRDRFDSATSAKASGKFNALGSKSANPVFGVAKLSIAICASIRLDLGQVLVVRFARIWGRVQPASAESNTDGVPQAMRAGIVRLSGLYGRRCVCSLSRP